MMMAESATTRAPGPLDTWEKALVAELRDRDRPIPWPHVSRIVGRNESDLRRLYDQPPPPPPPVVAAPLPAPAPTARKPRSGKDPKAPPNLALVLLTACDMTVPELALRMGWSGVVAKAVMGGLVRGGFAEQSSQTRPFSTWRITEAGRDKLARMTSPPPRGRPSSAQSLPNRALSLIRSEELTNRRLSVLLALDVVTAGSILGDLHRKKFVEPIGDDTPSLWRITKAGLSKLARARPWP